LRGVRLPALLSLAVGCRLLCKQLHSAMVFCVPGRGWVGDRHHRLLRSRDQGPCAPVRFPTVRPPQGHSWPMW
jgi:hypothetical protein